KKEVLRRRGENLSPTEVEEALVSHPSVLEAAVVGVPSELSEEEVKAFVVPAPGTDVDFPALRAHAATLLASYKVPRYSQAGAARRGGGGRPAPAPDARGGQTPAAGGPRPGRVGRGGRRRLIAPQPRPRSSPGRPGRRIG